MVLTGGERRQRNESIKRTAKNARKRNESIENIENAQHSKLFTLVIYANVSLSMGLGSTNINCRDCVPIMIEILG